MANNELKHWGVRGMKWGVRRYQNRDGSLTSAGKKRYGDSDTNSDPEAEKKAYEEGKQKALKSGSASEVLKYKGDLTPQEMQSAITRIRWEQDMQSLSSKEISAGKSKTDKLFNKIGDVTDYTNTAAKAWNTVANIYNAFSGTDKISLPKIDTNINNGNKKERKAEKKEKQKEEEAKKKRAEQEAQRESKQKERAEKRAKQESNSNSDDKVYEGEVLGSPTKKSKASTESKKRAETIIDVEWRDVTVSDLPVEYRDAGRTYVNALLEEPK